MAARRSTSRHRTLTAPQREETKPEGLASQSLFSITQTLWTSVCKVMPFAKSDPASQEWPRFAAKQQNVYSSRSTNSPLAPSSERNMHLVEAGVSLLKELMTYSDFVVL